MSLFKPAVLSPEQIEHVKKTRAKGRKHYIVYAGILAWGMYSFLLTTLCGSYLKYGWHVPPQRYLFGAIVIGLVVWPVAGYFWGAIMWKQVYEETIPRD